MIKPFFKKHFTNILFVLFIVILVLPQTRLPVQIFFQRILAGSPKVISQEKRKTVTEYSWQLVSLDNKPVEFSASSGQVTVVNLWATWCPPCLAEMPSLQQLFNKYGSKIDFYFVSDEPAPKLRQFLAKKNYVLPVYTELAPGPAELQSTTLPTTFVISKNGKIAMQKSGAANWNSSPVHRLLDELLAE